jgi:hypothetical protein
MSRPPFAPNLFPQFKNNSSTATARRPSPHRLTAGGSARRAGAFLALFALITTVFYNGSSSAASPARDEAGANFQSAARRPAAGAGLFSPAMFQFPADDLQTYAADCVTPKSDFNLGDTVCVRAGFPPTFFSFRSITWVDPANHILDAAFITSNGQTDLFTIPSNATSVVGDQIVDNRGTWRVDMRSADGSRTAVVSFDVHELANPRADLQISAVPADDTVASGASVQVKIYVRNAGPDAATNVSVSLPTVSGLTLQSFAQGTGPDCGSVCNIGSLARGGTAFFLATYNVTATAGTLLSGAATVASDTDDPQPSTNSDSFSITVLTPANPNETCTLGCPQNISTAGNENRPSDPDDPQSPLLFGSVVSYNVNATGNNCDPVNCDVPSGSFFPVGTTPVTCTAPSDVSCTFIVNVSDSRSLSVTANSPNPMTVECHTPFVDPGATASIAGATIATSGTVNVDVPGTYTLTYTATHTATAGDPPVTTTQTATTTRTVNVIDDSPPVISINGDDPLTDEIEPLTIECHTGFTDPGASATDACDGAVALVATNDVNPDVLGAYTITYSATDNQGTPTADDDLISTVTRAVHVVDTTAPVITLAGGNVLTVECHGAFTDPGATATDSCAGDFTSAIQVSGTVDPNVVNTYTLTYTVSDASGNEATATRTVNVVDTTAPVITVSGDSPVTVECHGSYTDAGATATDACGVVSVNTSGGVDVNTPGTYTITYTATDGTNTATATRTVNVVDTAAPTITLGGASTMTVECHTGFTDPGASAADACDTAVPVTASGIVNADVPGTYTITYTASDDSGNAAAPVTRTVNVVDTTPPVISCPANIVVNLPANSTATAMPVNFNVTASDSCGTAGVNTSHASGAIFPVGTTTVSATATDQAGNTSSCSFTVSVHYLFTGFFSPISNLPVVNTVKAGSAIPIKFSLSGNKGLNIFADDFPASGVVTCNSNAPAVDLSEIDTPGNSGLSYSAGSDQYHYNWKTLKAWEGTCRQLVVKLNDGTEHRANFKFK